MKKWTLVRVYKQTNIEYEKKLKLKVNIYIKSEESFLFLIFFVGIKRGSSYEILLYIMMKIQIIEDHNWLKYISIHFLYYFMKPTPSWWWTFLIIFLLQFFLFVLCVFLYCELRVYMRNIAYMVEWMDNIKNLVWVICDTQLNWQKYYNGIGWNMKILNNSLSE